MTRQLKHHIVWTRSRVLLRVYRYDSNNVVCTVWTLVQLNSQKPSQFIDVCTDQKKGVFPSKTFNEPEKFRFLCCFASDLRSEPIKGILTISLLMTVWLLIFSSPDSIKSWTSSYWYELGHSEKDNNSKHWRLWPKVSPPTSWKAIDIKV